MMKTTLLTIPIVLGVILMTGCAQLAPVLISVGQNLAPTPLPSIVTDTEDTEANSDYWPDADSCAPEDFECAAEQFERAIAEGGTIIQLTAICEIPDSDDDCVGTFTYEAWAFKPKSSVKAIHEGDGEFVVTLFREDSSSDVIFSATGVYTSETVILETSDVVSMTVQSTGPWEVDFKRVE
jgi:hypothetical protein